MNDSALSKEEEEKYARGYNAFAYIKEHEPDLIKELDSIKADGAYFDGLRQGRTNDRMNEFRENKLPDWMEGIDPLKEQFKENEKDITKDKDKGKDFDDGIDLDR